MVLAKSKNAVGLGNSLMNDRFKNRNSNMHKATTQAQGDITRKDQTGATYITPAKKEAEWMKMRSVTEQGALDEFLSTAELAGTDFTAEKLNNVKIIHADQKNPYLLSREEERGVLRKQKEKRARLTVPRRPKWDARTSKRELEERERGSLLEWRRGLAQLQEVEDLLLTPFERNIEVWRQLWRVIERSDLVVQIVDARNPLLFRCEDLERYVKEVDARKRNLLLVNKADMMTLRQRRVWAEYFVAKGINFRFFSAELAREINEARYGGDESQEEEDAELEDGDESDAEEDASLHQDEIEEEVDFEHDTIAKEAAKIDLQDRQEDEEQWVDEETIDSSSENPELDDVPITLEDQTRILTTDDLEALFLQHSPTTPHSPTDPNPDSSDPSKPHRSDNDERKQTTIGLVGYPNVGKSSTINALLGAKKVSVSATPGKTKHFQTIHLSTQVLLCDCPGLVFPNFATTKAELVVNGVLPIDQLREYTGPATLVAQRIPQAFLEAVYGMRIETRPVEEGGTGFPTGSEVLRAYARARGFWTQGLGQPDESRAARTVLKDFVRGKLLFVHPPPSSPSSLETGVADGEGGKEMDAREFNRELYDLAHLPQKRRAHLAASQASALRGTDDPSLMDDPDMIPLPRVQGRKGAKVDSQFFAPRGKNSNGVVLSQPFHYKYSEQGSADSAQQGKQLSGRKLKALRALEQDVDPKDLRMGGKKHFKGKKRKEIRNSKVKR